MTYYFYKCSTNYLFTQQIGIHILHEFRGRKLNSGGEIRGIGKDKGIGKYTDNFPKNEEQKQLLNPNTMYTFINKGGI